MWVVTSSLVQTLCVELSAPKCSLRIWVTKYFFQCTTIIMTFFLWVAFIYRSLHLYVCKSTQKETIAIPVTYITVLITFIFSHVCTSDFMLWSCSVRKWYIRIGCGWSRHVNWHATTKQSKDLLATLSAQDSDLS